MSETHSPADLSKLRQQVRAIVDELIPLEPLLLQGDLQRLLPLLDQHRVRVQAHGLWGLSLSKHLGGHGLGLDSFAALAEEMGRSPLAHYVFGCQAPEAGNIEVLHLFGTEAHKAEVLPELLSGRARSCFAMTERESSGANPTLLRTRAVQKGDLWQIDGEKWFTTGADGASYCIVMAVTDPEAAPHQRASLFLVPMNQPGLQVRRQVSVMGHPGSGPFSHAELRFEGCQVPASALIGKLGEGFRMAQARLGHGRIHHCARWIGIAQRSLDMLCERAKTRAVSEHKTLGDSDIIKAWIGEIAAELAAARLFVRDTARRIDEEGSQSARNEIAMIKYYVAGVMQRAVDKALQVYGAAGVSDDFILAFFYREERAARIYDGPDEVHKISVAKHLLKGKGETDARRG